MTKNTKPRAEGKRAPLPTFESELRTGTLDLAAVQEHQERQARTVIRFVRSDIPDFIREAVKDAIQKAGAITGFRVPAYTEPEKEQAHLLANLLSQTPRLREAQETGVSRFQSIADALALLLDNDLYLPKYLTKALFDYVTITLPSAADLARGADSTQQIVPTLLELAAKHAAEADKTISEWIADSDPADTKYEKDGESGDPLARERREPGLIERPDR